MKKQASQQASILTSTGVMLFRMVSISYSVLCTYNACTLLCTVRMFFVRRKQCVCGKKFFINFSSILKKPVWEENTSNFFINFSSMFHQSYFNFKSYLRITLIHCFLYHFIMTTNSYIGDNFLSITTACRGGFINEKRRQQIILLNCKYV